MFLNTGITFVSLRIEGKEPDSKERLKRKDRGPERSNFKRLMIFGGMLLGPSDLLEDNELIVNRTSAGLHGQEKWSF